MLTHYRKIIRTATAVSIIATTLYGSLPCYASNIGPQTLLNMINNHEPHETIALCAAIYIARHGGNLHTLTTYVNTNNLNIPNIHALTQNQFNAFANFAQSNSIIIHVMLEVARQGLTFENAMHTYNLDLPNRFTRNEFNLIIAAINNIAPDPNAIQGASAHIHG